MPLLIGDKGICYILNRLAHSHGFCTYPGHIRRAQEAAAADRKRHIQRRTAGISGQEWFEQAGTPNSSFLSEHAALCHCLFIHAIRRAGNCFWFPLSACSRLANPRSSTTYLTQTSGGGAAPLPEAMQSCRALTYCLQHNELGGGPKKDNKRSHRTRIFVTMNFIFDRT